jgi:integrase/recombinase XerC
MTDSFSASIAGYSDWLPFSPGRNKGPATVQRYVGIVTRFAAWCREHGRASFAEVTKADLRAWVNGLKGGQAAPGTKALSWWAIRSLFRYLSEEEGVPDIARSLTMHAPPVSDRISHLDAGDVRLLLRACQTARERAVIRVFLDAGLRISEAASLKVSDVIVDNLRSRRLIMTGKGGKTRAVVIGTQTAMELRRYLRERQKSPWAECEALWLGARGPLTTSGLRELVEATGRRASLQVHQRYAVQRAHDLAEAAATVQTLAALLGVSAQHPSEFFYAPYRAAMDRLRDLLASIDEAGARQVGPCGDPPHAYIPNGPVQAAPYEGYCPPEERQAAFAAVLEGVETGEYDRRIVTWLTQRDDTTCRTIASLLWRCRSVGAVAASGSVVLTPADAEVARQALADASAWRSWRSEGAGCEECARLDPDSCAGHASDEAQAASYDCLLRRLAGQEAAEAPGERGTRHEATLAERHARESR